MEELYENLMKCLSCGEIYSEEDLHDWIDQEDDRVLGDIVVEKEDNEDGRKPKCPECGGEVSVNWDFGL